MLTYCTVFSSCLRSLSLDGGKPYQVRLRPPHGLDRVALPRLAKASTVRITVRGVDLLAFGGFSEVRMMLWQNMSTKLLID